MKELIAKGVAGCFCDYSWLLQELLQDRLHGRLLQGQVANTRGARQFVRALRFYCRPFASRSDSLAQFPIPARKKPFAGFESLFK